MDSIPPVGEWECSHARLCTALLDEPGAVLTDRQRWPDRLCYPVMVESCRLWAVENAPDRVGEYPLPLDDGRRALLALRVRSRKSLLDLWGLEGKPRITEKDRRYAEYCIDPDDHLWVGPLDFVLAGREDTSLLHVISEAHAWWRHISLEKILGRPRGSGTYASVDEFRHALTRAVLEVRAAGSAVTQPKVEEALGVRQGAGGRQLRKWLRQYNISWSEATKL
jgi:hypothetical protein